MIISHYNVIVCCASDLTLGVVTPGSWDQATRHAKRVADARPVATPDTTAHVVSLNTTCCRVRQACE